MIKDLLFYFLIFLGIFLVSFSFHENYINEQGVILPFSLKKVYLFQMGFSLLICVNFKLFSNVDKIFSQLGFIYLGTLLLKILLFCAVFYHPIFNEENLSQTAGVSLLIPTLLFLLTEAFFVAKILNK
ncbi:MULTISPECIES: DUF6168 family protein [unclassified Polaribacter]|uniref:DUF6168 family protein n=1 Tax=unclassified Polaribacter TaxID=196858 RepID=UPI0011BE7B70|nr:MULTISPECIES: DUF6168 family protein [unclassified Polaribacter]TXD50587.1 hypothetical protein ES043_15445 [Polaribacter sp. IC063]TXD61724.1 hypothetical protein ES044_04360 [Polaribacter sp. IC066]